MRFTILFAAALAVPLFAAETTPAPDTAAILHTQTQELLDAITHGTPEVWDRYLDEHAVVTAEDGTVATKAAMVKDIKPLAAGVSGDIRAIDFNVVDHGSVAVATYVSDEHETYHGQQLHCQYRSTDTWVKTPRGWRLIASQVLALRTDPPAITLSAQQSAPYLGTYVLAPGITYEIRQRDGKLEGQRNGRPAESLLAESPDVFFVPGSPRYRKIFQRDAAGKITGFVERREAWDLTWTRTPAP
ncbi:MAG: DUF4440 domain-containing protein [Acidobacteria bacterium]|nr:DUF4440 domain-containing protein [Acidobacteriota bacterium]MBV9476646.1 DUF4440 domain-containing protein [Acidobacteriota bacterium]